MNTKEYEMDLKANNMKDGVKAWLVDHYTQTRTPIGMVGKTTFKFNVTTDQASGDSSRFLIIFDYTAPPAPKPSTVINLKAKGITDGIQVDWQTESEQAMDRYILERSSDGKHFNQAASVRSHGTALTTQNYGWFDADPLDGINYYRVKSISSTGEYLYSNTVTAEFIKGTPQVLLYPNPVVGSSFNLQWINMTKGNYKIELTDNIGHLVWKEELDHDGTNHISRMRLSAALARGVYTAHLIGNHFTKNWRVIID